MARTIKIDNDTLIGYNFMLSKYYVTNKGTTTYRATETLIKQILDIVAPNNQITTEQILTLKTQLEQLQSLQYTWSDNGAYIKTLQINDYEENPIVLDADKKKLYIMNTNLIFDLTLSESKQSRTLYLQAYFKDHFGLDLTYQQLLAIYDFLISFYKPYTYNVIEDITLSPLKYSNKFALSNYQGTKQLKAQYSCTCNPNNQFNYPVISYITSTDSTTNTIQLTTPISLPINSTIVIKDATTTTSSYTLSADGTYTIKAISNNTITTNETIPYSYTYNYPTCTLINSTTNIQSINRDTMTISLTNPVPSGIMVGDIIHVSGTQEEIEGVTVSCDGTYTIGSISGSNIVVQEVIPTNYTYTTGTYPTISKHVELGNVEGILNKVITFTANLPIQPIENSKIILTKEEVTTILTVITSTTNTIRVIEEVEGFSPSYPQLQQPTPYTDILIYVNPTNNEDLFPIGEFMVDNFTQCQQYISTYLESMYVPSQEVYNLVGKDVPTQYPHPPIANIPMTLKGVYSQVFSE